MKTLRTLLSMALILLLLAGCGSKGPTVAKVNGEGIDKAEFDRTVENYKKVYISSGLNFEGEKGKERLEILKKQVLDQLVMRSLELQEAEKRGVAPKKGEIEKRVNEIKKAYGGNFEEMLKSQNMTEKDFAASIDYQMTRDALFKDITKAVKVNDTEIEQYVKDHPEEMVGVKARQILVTTKNRSDAEAKKIAGALWKELTAGKDFATLAKAKSDDLATKNAGGLMANGKETYLRRNMMGSEIENELFSLKAGQISKAPLKTGSGYVIVKVEEVRKLALKDVRDELKQKLLRLNQVRDYNNFLMELKKKAKIESDILDAQKGK